MNKEEMILTGSEYISPCKIHRLIITLFWTLLLKFNICFVIFSHNLFLTKLQVDLVIDTFRTLYVISKRQSAMSQELLIS